MADYVQIFDGAHDVLDVGCGRGEFLLLLREQGIRAHGIDVNGAMVDVCREQGLDAEHADALAYLRQQTDGSIGGLFAAQVIEHLEPRYLTAFLDAAFDKLRPGAPIVLETINPACWFAFFESYIRDLTHVRPVHPETLQFLLVAAGFQRVEIRYRSPYPEHEKLQPLAAHASLGDVVDTLNANVERINRLLFTWLDYAAVGRRS
jgi:O-antigen chain-terminating methyltransferase